MSKGKIRPYHCLLIAALLLTLCVHPMVIPLLAFGWVGFLHGVVSKVHVRWDGVATFVIALALFSFLLHRLAIWLRREMAPAAGPWRFRFTAYVVALLITMFVAGVAMVGVSHQVVWLWRTEPMFVPALPGGAATTELNLKSAVLAISNYVDIENHLSPGQRMSSDRAAQSWVTISLPFMSHQRDFDESLPWDHPANFHFFTRLVPKLLNPRLQPLLLRDQRGYGLSHFAANAHLFENGQLPQDHNKLLLGEVCTNFQPWGKPGEFRDPALRLNRSPQGFGGPAGDGAYFAMLDGSVRFFPKETDPKVLRQLSGCADGEESQ